MGTPLISVIVPVYNVKPYLRNCLDSILRQSNEDWEAIVIDDGSTDGSGEICDEYARRDKRFKAYHQENKGVSAARNVGLDHVLGNWIAFIDADDEVTSDFLEIQKDSCKCDVIVKGFIEKGADFSCEHAVNDFDYDGVRPISRWYLRSRNNALWDKFIKKSVINETRFDTSLKIGEDLLFFLSIVKNISHVISNKTGRYIYYQRSNSAMSQKVKDGANIDRCLYISEQILANTSLTEYKILGESLIAQLYLPLVSKELRKHSPLQKEKFRNICNNIHFNSIMTHLSKKEIFRYYYSIVRMILS